MLAQQWICDFQVLDLRIPVESEKWFRAMMYHLKSSFHFKMKIKDIDDYFMLVYPHVMECKQG
jgi:hypothetical protein